MSIEPRKQPKQSRSVATVDAVLEATAHILEHEGLSALNTNRIAEKAGVSVGSLYQYFPTKEAILTEIIRRKRERLISAVENALDGSEGQAFELGMERLVAAVVANQLHWPKLARSLEYAEAFLPLEVETDVLKRRIGELIGGFLAHHKVENLHVATQDVIAMTRGIVETAGLNNETDQAEISLRVGRAVRGYLGRS